MQIEITEAKANDRPVVERLLQLYQYDFGEIMGGDVGEDGVYHNISLDETWNDPVAHTYLVRVDGMLAGLAIVIERSHFTGATDVTYMDEFFVMRKYRRLGVGKEAAARLFDLSPGRWEVAEVVQNTGALAFWRQVIGEYTGGRYEERFEESDLWHGPVQTFDTRQRA